MEKDILSIPKIEVKDILNIPKIDVLFSVLISFPPHMAIPSLYP